MHATASTSRQNANVRDMEQGESIHRKYEGVSKRFRTGLLEQDL
jgi:hypothetical protein